MTMSNVGDAPFHNVVHAFPSIHAFCFDLHKMHISRLRFLYFFLTTSALRAVCDSSKIKKFGSAKEDLHVLNLSSTMEDAGKDFFACQLGTYN